MLFFRWAFARANIWRSLFSNEAATSKSKLDQDRYTSFMCTELRLIQNIASVLTRSRRFCRYANFAKHVLSTRIFCVYTFLAVTFHWFKDLLVSGLPMTIRFLERCSVCLHETFFPYFYHVHDFNWLFLVFSSCFFFSSSSFEQFSRYRRVIKLSACRLVLVTNRLDILLRSLLRTREDIWYFFFLLFFRDHFRYTCKV